MEYFSPQIEERGLPMTCRARWTFLLALWVSCTCVGCKRPTGEQAEVLALTVAELRSVKGTITVAPPDEAARTPYPRERLSSGARVEVPAGGLAWLRRDGGATWLLSGPALLTVKDSAMELSQGRAFVDTQAAEAVLIQTPKGSVELAEARASIEVADAQTDVYVLRGTARVGDAQRATSGEQLTLAGSGEATRKAVVAWEDWTGGLGTADPSAEPAPFGIGTVGARKPGDKGKPRFSLVIQRLDVNVTIERDFAITEVDQTFVNPSSDTVEGIFSFRTPPGAVLRQFGVDRDGDVVWGRVKESAEAVRQYESNVYEGSTEDPALLQWAGLGVYNARLYPIKPGSKRRVVTRYAQWLSRQGDEGERRLYVYPMAAEGAKGSLPRIEEMTVNVDLSKAEATSVRSGMKGQLEKKHIVVKAFDFVPRADLAVELFDGGLDKVIAYRASHALHADEAPEDADEAFAKKVSGEEDDYIAVPLRAPPLSDDAPKGLDLAIVVDASAATEPSALAISRTIARSLLSHLGPDDRAALWAGDATLRPVTADSGTLQSIDGNKKKAWLTGLSSVERGGATDIGALLTEAAEKLDPKRRGAVLYVGDGSPSVGELAPKDLRERLARLPESTRVLVAAVGSQPNVALLESLVRGAPVEQVFDAYGAARASLRLLEAAGKPMWLGAKVDLGPGVERILPRQLPPIGADETLIVVGRVSGKTPKSLQLLGSGGTIEHQVLTRTLDDHGDLRRRWGQERLLELMEEGAGRASLVDIGRRFGLISPVTSWYVPTKREAAAEQDDDDGRSWFAELGKYGRWQPWGERGSPFASEAEAVMAADNKEGGTGTRAKGEEGSMGKETSTNKRYAVQGPKDNAAEFGMIGLLNAGASGDGAPEPMHEEAAEEEAKAPAAVAPADEPMLRPARAAKSKPASARAPSNRRRGDSDDFEAGGGLGLGSIGTIGHGAGTGTGQGFGGGGGRLGGSHVSTAPRIRMGATTVSGRLPKEVVQRIVRQNFGRFRLCYERGLQQNPNLEGRVAVSFSISQTGAVEDARNGGSSLPDASVVACIVSAFRGLSFPRPESGRARVIYPMMLSPGDVVRSPDINAPERRSTRETLAVVGHRPRPCGPAAYLPLSERRILWRERLAGASSASFSLAVYRQALRDCEASDWRERSALLIQIVDRLPYVRDRVELWRALLAVSPVAADAVYRFMLLRVRTATDLRDLHDALGLTRIEPELLEKLLKKAKTAAERLALLRGAAERFADDAELALMVLDAYEDAGDHAGGRAWARKLRRRVDATSHTRTAVGEYYFRLATKGRGKQAERDREEARRTFGEIVEFAPEDPLARRRLGDLLRAHGWYESALRQYKTLQALTPDDSSVPLLLATAAQGLGKTEQAVRWTEKAAESGAPDGAGPVSLASRALASAFLAWSRQQSAKERKLDEVERLKTRAARLAAASGGRGTRVILTWAHPELRAQLWTDALGSMMPAQNNLPLLGVAEAFVPESTPRRLELRLDPEDAATAARLNAQARLTVISNEGQQDEHIVTVDVAFTDAEGKAVEKRSFQLSGAKLEEVTL